MSGALPHPNIEPRPGQKFGDGELAAVLAQIQENFDELNGRFPVAGSDLIATYIKAKNGKGVAATGIVNLVWTASTQSATALVKHGLGVAPTFVGLTPILVPSAIFVAPRVTGEPSSTEFGCMAVLGGSFTTTIPHQWVALG